MGMKGCCFSSIKKTSSPIPKEKKTQKSEKIGFVEEHPSIPSTSVAENAGGSTDSRPFPPPLEEVKPIELENELPKTANLVAASTGGGGAAATTSTGAAATRNPYSGKSKEEVAAIRIQTEFRGYLARRVLWALRGLVRLKSVIEGGNVNRQTDNMLKRIRSQSHILSQINSRRIRMSEENQARQILKQAKEIANLQLQNGDEWNDSVQSKEEMETKLLSRYEATMRRERAMAYSFSHQQQWKKSAGVTNMLFMDPSNPRWGWSWSERYMAARPWEARGKKDPGNDHAAIKTGADITGSEITKSYARRQLNSAPSTPRSRAGGPIASRKSKPGPSPQALVSGVEPNPDDDSISVVSVQSGRSRRHSVGGTVVRNDENLTSSPIGVKRTVAAKSAKAKLGGQGLSENSGGSAKKQLSFPGSPVRPRRQSGPPKVETTVE